MAHAHIGAFLERVEIGDMSVGFCHIGPCRTRRHEAPAEVLGRLLYLRTHAVDTCGLGGRYRVQVRRQ